MAAAPIDNSPGEPTGDPHRWSDLDPMVRFGVALAMVLFLGVVIEGALLVPYALLTNGWTPGR
jgi:hypothetical protein